jgi:hypothetical protein
LANTPKKILTPAKAWSCAAMNQLAFPGAGTVMAGRKVGYYQATIMVAGFLISVSFMVWYIGSMLHGVFDMETNEQMLRDNFTRHRWILFDGLLLCGIAWFWALMSSIEILRSAQREPPRIPA